MTASVLPCVVQVETHPSSSHEEGTLRSFLAWEEDASDFVEAIDRDERIAVLRSIISPSLGIPTDRIASVVVTDWHSADPELIEATLASMYLKRPVVEEVARRRAEKRSSFNEDAGSIMIQPA